MNVKVEILITAVEKDKYGKVLRTVKKKARSYVRAMADMLYCHMAGVATNIIDINNTPQSITPSGGTFGLNGGAGTSIGIVVGTGTNAVTISDYKLQTIIAEGMGSGQLLRGANSIASLITVGSSRQFTVARTFTNQSGAGITVEEVGLYTQAWGYYFLLERSLLNFTIGNGNSGTVTYTIKVTV